MKEVKKIPQMTKEEMIDYLWVCYQTEGKDLASLKLIEALATQLNKEKK